MKKDNMNIGFKTSVAMLLTFIFGGVIFRHGNDILDGISVWIQNILALKNAEISGKIEDVNIDVHKKWTVTKAEFPENSRVQDMQIMGFQAGDFMDEGYEDDEEDYE